ncbi:MAG: LapA family protein [Gammaproteobacteria bacterium]|uniref:LapA family protein n=1 Tax=Azohydromonas sp. TaxID=1872666 RepID=UPI002CF1FC4F|nr:LapA family protein [Azohydromonas sp.]HMM87449.1 LapA family protein [Azohydromonas sp.]
MRALVWLLRALVFFTLFAFALNNQQDAVVRWFFGVEWRAPMVIVVLAAFAAGCGLGVLAMTPGWWRGRQLSRRPPPADDTPRRTGTEVPPAPPGVEHPPREGL